MAPTLRNTRNRAAMDPSIPKKLTSAIVSSIATTASDTIQITFAARVQSRGLPAFKAGAAGAETVQAVTQISDTVLELTFTGSVATSDLIVAENDPAVRTPTGGFVPAGTYTIGGIVP